MIKLVTADDEEKFELVCSTLSNKSARLILEKIKEGIDTAAGLAGSIGLSIQTTIDYLHRLELAGIIEKDSGASSFDYTVFRGRTPRHYKLSKIAVLLVPSRIESRDKKSRLIELLGWKSWKLLKERILLSIVITTIAEITILGYVSAILGSTGRPFYGGVHVMQPLISQSLVLLAVVLTAAIVFSISWLLVPRLPK
ncbi:MAG TPA: hypothetical protein VFF30_01945 [Nitrososphaerales archaeon]|nr:hypothetical protein [Nitrososphaerales archaeon]